MTARILTALLLFTCATCAVNAADQTDTDLLRRALTAMQTQRNQAMDVAAEREAQLMVELAKVQARVKELEAKAEPAK